MKILFMKRMKYTNSYMNSLVILLLFLAMGCNQDDNNAVEEGENTETVTSPGMDAIEPATDITDTDIEKFLDAVEQVQYVNQVAQEEMMAAVESEGMSLVRFSQIQEKLMNSDAPVDPISVEEESQLDRIDAKMRELEPELERQSREAIETTGMTPERYQALSLGIQADSSLTAKAQMRMQQRMMQKLQESAKAMQENN